MRAEVEQHVLVLWRPDARRQEVQLLGVEEGRHERRRWIVVNLGRSADVLKNAAVQDRDPVRQGQGLHLVVRDVDRGDAERPDQRGDLHPQLGAHAGVQVRQRLVHEEELGLAHDRPAHRDPLALAAGERAGAAVEGLVDVQRLGQLGDALADHRRV